MTFDQIPFNDDADEVRTWKGLAISAIMDLRGYAHDVGPERRLVSAEAYEDAALRLQNTLNEYETDMPGVSHDYDPEIELHDGPTPGQEPYLYGDWKPKVAVAVMLCLAGGIITAFVY